MKCVALAATSEEQDTVGKCLEKQGSKQVLIVLQKRMKSNHIFCVCHDKSTATSSLIKEILHRHHPSCLEAYDLWHFLKRINKEAKALTKKHPTLQNFSEHLKGVFYHIAYLVPHGTTNFKVERLKHLFNCDWYEFYPGLTPELAQSIYELCLNRGGEFSKVLEEGTSIGESFMSHNLVYFQKKQHYPPFLWKSKVFASFLDWNRVPNWQQDHLTITFYPFYSNINKPSKELILLFFIFLLW
jgi:hypothetical protein